MADGRERPDSQRAVERTDTTGKQLFLDAPVGYALVDGEATILEANRALAGLLGETRAGLVGRRVCSLVAESRVLEFLGFWNDMVQGDGSGRLEVDLRGDSGPAQRVRLECGWSDRPAGGTGRIVFIDLTDRAQDDRLRETNEERVRRMQRLEAIGRLAGGVAHRFNNLLTVVLGSAELIAGEVARSPIDVARILEAADEIRESGDAASTLVTQLLALGSRRETAFRTVDVNRVIERLEALLVAVIPDRIQLISSRPDEPMWVRTDEAQFEQVVLNLVINACEAMPDGGNLSIRCGPASASDLGGPGAPGADSPPGAFILCEVRDDGQGMDEATLDQVFEPFFSTKPDREGMGLGLSLAHSLLSASGGRIAVRTHPGQGTSVRAFFPRVDEDASAGAGHSTAPAIAEALILLCEDHDSVRRLLRGTLEDYGFTVLEASNGREALESARGAGLPLDLVITDKDMPGMSGDELARRLRRDQPGLPVLFITGHSRIPPNEDRLESLDGSFLQKPFSLVALVEQVRALLAGVGDSDRET